MTKRAWLNLVMLLVLVGLGLIVVYQPGLKQPPPLPKLTPLKTAEIERIYIQRPGGEPISLERQTGIWWIASPIKIPANEVRLDSILQAAQADVQTQFDASGQDLAKYGLDVPTARVRFNDLELMFGAAAPLGGQRYVMSGSNVYLIADRHYAAINGEVTLLVSRNIVPPGSKLAGIALPDRELRRSDTGKWSVVPPQPELSGDAINTFVDEWRNAQALRMEKYSDEKAQGEIILHLDGKPETLRLLIISRDPELILARPDVGMQYSFSREQSDKLLQFPASSETLPPPGQKGPV